KRAFLLVFLTFVFVGLFSIAHKTHALTITWDGGGGDNNWSTCANWDNSNTCPGGSDVATFNGTNTKDATIDGSFAGSVLGINIASGYTGTVTQARSLTIGTSGYTQAAGIFTGATQTIDMNDGSFSLSGGTFTSTSGTLF